MPARPVDGGAGSSRASANAGGPGARDHRRRRGSDHRRRPGAAGRPVPARAVPRRGRASGATAASRWWRRCSPTTPSWSPTSAVRTPRHRHGHGDPRRRALLQRLKRHPWTRHIPTVVAHAAEAAEDAQRALSGALGVLEEPVTRAELDDALGRTSTRSSAPASAGCSSSPRGPTATPPSSPTAFRSRRLDVDVTGPEVAATAALDGDRYDCVLVDLGSRRRRLRRAQAAPVAQAAARTPGRGRPPGRATDARSAASSRTPQR